MKFIVHQKREIYCAGSEGLTSYQLSTSSGYKLGPLRHSDKLLLVTLRFLALGATVDPETCMGLGLSILLSAIFSLAASN